MRSDRESHLTDFLVDALHELKDEVDEFLLLEAEQVLVRDQEREVVVLVGTALPQNLKLVRSQRHESFKHVGEEVLNFI